MEKYKGKTEKQLQEEADNALNLERDTELWIINAAQLDLNIKPSEELAKVDHYSTFPSVTISPDVKKFWENQQNALLEIDTKTPQNEFLNAFREHENYKETLAKLERSQIGTNSFEEQKKSARDQIKDAKENLKKARKAKKDIYNQVSPGQVFLGKLVGNSKEFDAFVEARLKTVPKAKKSLAKAKENLTRIEENESKYHEQVAQYHVKLTMATRKMNTALAKIKENQNIANKIDLNSKKMSEKLNEQYAIIDKYQSIQTLKKQSNYKAIHEILSNNSQNNDMVKSLDAIPESLPASTFVISLNGLQVNQSPEKLAEIEDKLIEIGKTVDEKTQEKSDIEAKLFTLSDKKQEVSDLKTKIENFKLKDDDSIPSLEEQKKDLDKDSEEYKNIEIKIEHLKNKNAVDTAKKRAEALKDEKTQLENKQLGLDPNSDEYKQLNDEINEKNEMFNEAYTAYKNCKDLLNEDEYSQKLGKMEAEHQEKCQELLKLQQLEKQKKALEEEIKKLEDEKQTLKNQKGNFKAQEALKKINIPDLAEALSKSQEQIGNTSLSEKFEEISEGLKKARKTTLDKLSEKYQKLPIEKQNNHNEQNEHNENDGHDKNDDHDEHDDDDGR